MKRRGVKDVFWKTYLNTYQNLLGKDALCFLEKGGIQNVVADKTTKRPRRWRMVWALSLVIGIYFVAISHPMKPVGFLPFPTGYPRANLR